ncbi:MAG: DUF2332 family protein [Parvibaculaceae bacterium]
MVREVVDDLDPSCPVVVMYSMTTVQFTDVMRQEFNAALEACAAARPFARISMEIVGPSASLNVSGRSVSRPDIVGRADIDGRWIQWVFTSARG